MRELPCHIAIIMDGNGRWAKKRFLPRVIGHQFALKRIKEILRYLSDHGCRALTLYAFSTENWKRPKKEVGFLMNLVTRALKDELEELNANNVHFRVLGEASDLPLKVQKILTEAENLMLKNSGISLNIALNYGSRAEIIRAVKHLVQESHKPYFSIDDLNEEKFSSFLYTKDLPELDLVIRTGGEFRLSNFLLWQSAYAELYFTDILFPDFGVLELQQALSWYQSRERRYGMISEQLYDKTSNAN